MRRPALALLVCLCGGCGYTWRPALVVSVDAVHASRTLLDDGRSASRWDVRAQASLVLVPRPVRPMLRRDEPPRASRRRAAPCLSAWLCAWERAARDRTLAGFAPASQETVR